MKDNIWNSATNRLGEYPQNDYETSSTEEESTENDDSSNKFVTVKKLVLHTGEKYIQDVNKAQAHYDMTKKANIKKGEKSHSM